MEMTGSHIIPAARERVFEALNDPSILQQCIPGCQSLERLTGNELAATVVVRIGAMPAKFNCTVRTSDQVPPERYRITGEGRAGAAGSASGGAVVTLTPDKAGTLLRYEVSTELEGMLRNFGANLLDPIAKDLSETFFENLSGRLSADSDPENAAKVTSAPVAATIRPPLFVWIAAAIVVAAVLYLSLR